MNYEDYTSDLVLHTPDSAYIDQDVIDFNAMWDRPEGEDFEDEHGYGYYDQTPENREALFPGDRDWNDGNDTSMGKKPNNSKANRFEGMTTAEVNKMIEEDGDFGFYDEDDVSDLIDDKTRQGDMGVETEHFLSNFEHLSPDAQLVIGGELVSHESVMTAVHTAKEVEEYKGFAEQTMAEMNTKFESMIKAVLRGQAETDLRRRDTLKRKQNETNPYMRGQYDLELQELNTRQAILNDAANEMYQSIESFNSLKGEKAIKDTEYTLNKEFRDWRSRKAFVSEELSKEGIDMNTVMSDPNLFKLVQEGLQARSNAKNNKQTLKRVKKANAYGVRPGNRGVSIPRQNGKKAMDPRKAYYANNMGNMSDRDMSLAFDHLED